MFGWDFFKPGYHLNFTTFMEYGQVFAFVPVKITGTTIWK
jgi:hypothetical protein